MQKPNAAPDYEQNLLERIVLKTGWRFKSLQMFSTAPWKAWSFVLFAAIAIVAGAGFASESIRDYDWFGWLP
jgi:hypothetical protein